MLIPEVINELLPALDGTSGEDQVWQLAEENREELFESVLKTVIRQAANQHSFSRKLRAEDDAMSALSRWSKDVQTMNFDRGALQAKFDKVIADRDWRWLPGKEVVQLIERKRSGFWAKVKQLGEESKLSELFKGRQDISSLIDEARIKGPVK